MCIAAIIEAGRRKINFRYCWYASPAVATDFYDKNKPN